MRLIPTFDWGKQILYLVDDGELIAVKPMCLRQRKEGGLRLVFFTAKGDTKSFPLSCVGGKYVTDRLFATPSDFINKKAFEPSYIDFLDITESLGYETEEIIYGDALPNIKMWRGCVGTCGVDTSFSSCKYKFELNEKGAFISNLTDSWGGSGTFVHKTKWDATNATIASAMVVDFDGVRKLCEDKSKVAEKEITITIKIVG